MLKKILMLMALLVLGTGCADQEVKNVTNDKEVVADNGVVNDSKVDEKKMETAKVESVKYDPILHADKNFAMELDIPIFMFHYIENVPADTDDQMRYNLSYSPDKLEALLQNIEKNQIETLTFWDIKAIAEGKKEKPKRAVILSFDDGHNNHYTQAFQILKKHNMKGVFFIISDKPGNDDNYATWDQIAEMAQGGMEIGSHTVSHLNLADLSDDEIEKELVDSKKLIAEKAGVPVISLCYPAGKYDDRVIEIASQNYLFARTTQNGSMIDWQNRWELPTIRMFPTTASNLLDGWWE